eukprot:NODE_1134_length_1641_cov_132.477543_g1066_i0.p1 GENE.NODE_1134_length_1641_cov_132.477543_g1066_i0~~NODE_1134_length_1641_cov_132.477543_g1066_i0.p1  ORF type:complete len:518 (-),score=60.70 NODE_1134_length_1641_cov_132.477543_g1066_i0:88-1482(-)
MSRMSIYLPIVYTPVVGEACQKFGQIWRTHQGMYLNPTHRGIIRSVLNEWSQPVDIIVVTDGSRILGLGDLGANGMGIPIGKLSLYIACAGFNPERTLPTTFDLGTSNQKLLLPDSHYLGYPAQRPKDETYYALWEEFMKAVTSKWPKCVVQFEDISNNHCFALLEKHRGKYRCFNDDIQGTGAVIAAGFISACKVSGVEMKDQRILFYGAGAAGVGVADTIRSVMVRCGIDSRQSQSAFYMVDTKGLVTHSRGDKLASHKVPYARHEEVNLVDLLEIVKYMKPTCIIGLSGTPGVFTPTILQQLTHYSPRPLVFALSNPTSQSECTAQAAYSYTNGTAVFASGSPFDPVTFNGTTYYPAQGNNMYIFPGLGLGSFLSQAKQVTDSMITEAAVALADCVPVAMHAQGTIYPPMDNIREISHRIACRVFRKAHEEGVALRPMPANLDSYVQQNMWQPNYSTASKL